jgi:hypothetical protein
MSAEADFTRAVVDIRNALAQTFNEGLQTHGPAVVMSALAMFTASAVHQAEHLSADPQSRNIVLGQWLSHFHTYLTYLNQECDDQVLMNRKPEGMA